MNYSFRNKLPYANGGEMLNQFQNGGTHEQNPNGGIPIGDDASVEEGETMTETPEGKFVYSNRITLSKEDAKQYDLPKSYIGKSMADISEKINKMFEGRTSKIDSSTKAKMLDKVADVQEEIKASKQAEISQAMQANQEQTPEGLSERAPEGMEAYAEPQESQIPQEGQESQEVPQTVSAMAYGGYKPTFPLRHRYDLGGGLTGFSTPDGETYKNIGDYVSRTSMAQPTASATPSLSSPNIGGAITGGLSMIQGLIKPTNTGIDTSGKTITDIPKYTPGQNIASSSVSMASQGADLGTKLGGPGLGTAIGAGAGLIGGIAKGIFGNQAIKRDQNTAINNNADLATQQFSDNYAYGGNLREYGVFGRGTSTFAEGGTINIKPENRGKFTASAEAAGEGVQEHAHNVVNNPNSTELQRKRAQFAINASKWQHALGGNIKYAGGGPFDVQNKPLVNNDPYFATSQMNPDYTPYFATSRTTPITGTGNTGFSTPNQQTYTGINDYIHKQNMSNVSNPQSSSPNIGVNWNQVGKVATQAGMLSPVIGNLAQLNKLRKTRPEVVNAIENSARYNPQLADEAIPTNQINTAYNNTIGSILGATGGSGAAARASMLAASANRGRDLSSAYQNIADINRGEYGKAYQANAAINEANIARAQQAADQTAQNRATRDNAISAGKAAIFGDIGEFTKQQFLAKNIGKATGYNIYGQYLQDPTTGSWMTLDGKPATAAQIQEARLLQAQSEAKKADSAPKAKGGYIKTPKYRF